MKRALDLIAAVLGLALLSPILLTTALLILVCDGKPVFFRQVRIGYRGRPFHIWKFRTMRPSHDGESLQITVEGDQRITCLGSWLRRTKLDELPQLINVARGEMTFVGPRPEVERYVRWYSDDQKEVLQLVPGITDPAAIRYRYESQLLAESCDPEQTYITEIMPDKIRINLQYAAEAHLISDLFVIVKTIARLLQAAPAVTRRPPQTPLPKLDDASSSLAA